MIGLILVPIGGIFALAFYRIYKGDSIFVPDDGREYDTSDFDFGMRD